MMGTNVDLKPGTAFLKISFEDNFFETILQVEQMSRNWLVKRCVAFR